MPDRQHSLRRNQRQVRHNWLGGATKRLVVLAIVSSILLTSCGAQPAPTPTPRSPPTLPEAVAATATPALPSQAAVPPTPVPTTTTPAPAPTRPARPGNTPAPTPAPDTICHRANILTTDPGQPNASAIAIKDDVIMALGLDFHDPGGDPQSR